MDFWIRVDVFAAELCLTALVLFWIRRSQSRRDRFPWAFLGELLVWGGVAALIAAFVELRFTLQATQLHNTISLITTVNSFAPSLIEELAKYVVGVFLVLTTRHAHKLSDTVIYFILIGLGFSLVEDVFFLLRPETVAPYRLLSFYIHSGTAAMVGYSFARLKFGLSGYRQLISTLLLAVLLHGLYNYTVQPENVSWMFPLSLILTFGISAQVFLIFLHAKQVEQKLDRGKQRIKHPARAKYFGTIGL